MKTEEITEAEAYAQGYIAGLAYAQKTMENLFGVQSVEKKKRTKRELVKTDTGEQDESGDPTSPN